MTSQDLAKVPDPEAKAVEAADAAAKPLIKVSSRQSRHLAQAVVLEESGTSPLIRFTMLVVSAATLCFLVWSALTHVSEVALTEGTVVPTSSIQTIQHLEGGVVQEVLVKEGQTVEAGEGLIQLNPAQALGELEQSRAREAGLLIKAERLRAFAEERKPDFSRIGKEWARLIEDNQAIYETAILARESARSVIRSQIEQKRSEMQLLDAQQKTLMEQISALSESMRMREQLVNKGLVSRVVYLDTRRELSRIQGEYNRNQSQINTAREAMQEVENRLADNLTSLHRQTMDELGTVVSELAQVQESLGRLEDRAQRTVIVSPLRGIVKGLAVKNAGAVIPPGGLVCEIVPVDGNLTVDTRISTRDIGHVRPGQPVKVKVSTYDFARYGSVNGQLTRVSASSFLDEKGEPYFKGVVTLERNYVGDDPDRFRIMPGMTVQAEVVTGDKTLLQYMLKPVFTQIQQSFHER